MDDNAHGTHVAGIIASAANEYGTVGVAYNAKIMALKALQYSGIGNAGDIAEAIYYAVENGADILNMSFGSYSPSEVIKDALKVAYGRCVLVAAAGNDALHNDPKLLVDGLYGDPMYPAAFEWVVGVQATQQGGGLAWFSNWDSAYGNRWEYEVAAPGTNVRSLLPNGGYANWNGTSMAAPVVSGIAALLRTAYPDKQDYNSRFVMGQLLVGGVNESSGRSISPNEIVDAHRILTETAKPSLSYTSHLMFDGSELSQQNNDDGAVNAGETVDLALSIRNRWGNASMCPLRSRHVPLILFCLIPM
jgi:subtilisin family serine protease